MPVSAARVSWSLWVALALLALAVMGDAVVTVWCATVLPFREMNPAMAFLLRWGGIQAWIGVKVAALLIAGALFTTAWQMAPAAHIPRRWLLYVCWGIATGQMVVVAWNTHLLIMR